MFWALNEWQQNSFPKRRLIVIITNYLKTQLKTIDKVDI
jgi:hypothetical protein